MIGIDAIVIGGIMLIVFFRHAAVYNDPNKINYTPIVLALSVIGSLLHIVIHSNELFNFLILKESLLLLAAGISLSAVMSVMSQSVWAMNADANRSKIISLSDEVDSLKSLLRGFDQRLEQLAQMENSTNEQLRSSVKEEIDALNAIQANQKHFITKIESLLAQQHIAMEKFEEFTLTELPGLDNVVHRHIDLLRIAEQDHFNQLKNVARQSADEQKQLHAQLESMKQQLVRIEADRLPEHTVAHLHKELDKTIREFARQLQTIGAKSESIVTTLLENDAILKGSREQSELIMQQMVLSSKQMREITLQSKELSESLKPLGKLFVGAETLLQEFGSAKGKLSELVVMIEAYERQDHHALREHLKEAAEEIGIRIDALGRLIEETRRSSALVDTKNVQELASKVRLHKSYLGENQE